LFRSSQLTLLTQLQMAADDKGTAGFKEPISSDTFFDLPDESELPKASPEESRTRIQGLPWSAQDLIALPSSALDYVNNDADSNNKNHVLVPLQAQDQTTNMAKLLSDSPLDDRSIKRCHVTAFDDDEMRNHTTRMACRRREAPLGEKRCSGHCAGLHDHRKHLHPG
jgi:hypothetical protein